MIDVKPLESYFISLPSTSIINRLNAMWGKTPKEKKVIYDEAMTFLDAQGKREKWQKAFDRALTN